VASQGGNGSIIEGSATFLFPLVSMWILLDFPESETGSARWFFTEEERRLATDRVARDRVSAPKDNESVMHGLKLAVKGYRTCQYSLSPSMVIPVPMLPQSLMLTSNHNRQGLQSRLQDHHIRLHCTQPFQDRPNPPSRANQIRCFFFFFWHSARY
jgi:hypothetical protein